ncbi:MAG TPA: DUF6285 domain-containing protein [Stellaceae bacterium]|nr:DUF6285 domain-containing protein [Stellaceae bacterium]
MRDRPDGASLRALAEQAAERGEAPELVARARAIAAREAAAGAAPVEAIRRELAGRWGEGSIEELLRRLAEAIRAGAFDAPGPEQRALHRALGAITEQKLAESNPDYLAAARRR